MRVRASRAAFLAAFSSFRRSFFPSAEFSYASKPARTCDVDTARPPGPPRQWHHPLLACKWALASKSSRSSSSPSSCTAWNSRRSPSSFSGTHLRRTERAHAGVARWRRAERQGGSGSAARRRVHVPFDGREEVSLSLLAKRAHHAPPEPLVPLGEPLALVHRVVLRLVITLLLSFCDSLGSGDAPGV